MFEEISDLIKTLGPTFKTAWQIFKTWWWLLLPILFFKPLKFLYRFWRMEKFDSTVKRVLLEIKIPKEIMKPIKAMEEVFAGLHAIHDVFTWREIWIEGQFLFSLSFEIASFGGEIHFYIRTPEQFADLVKGNIYAQYPEVEIFEVEDYTLKVPQNIPNRNWDLFGMELINTKDEVYPIRTYQQYEKGVGIETIEEKRIDPIAGLLEGMAILTPGEQFWFQIIAKPIRDEKPWVKKGLEIKDKLARRPAKPKPKPIIRQVGEVLISGRPPGASPVEEKEIIPPEMKLTPGEREIVKAIEDKIAKPGFDCNIRYLYLAKRDVFFKPKARIPFGYIKELGSESLGAFKPWKKTMPKVKSVFFWFLDERRVYLRKRRIFRYYQKRWPPLFPRSGGTYVLNTEELATLYHFPSQIVAPAPGIARVEVRKGEAPLELPRE